MIMFRFGAPPHHTPLRRSTPAGGVRGLTVGTAIMLAAASSAMAAPHAVHHRAKRNADITDLSSGVTQQPNAQVKPPESRNPAPPPPDGYEPVADLDEHIATNFPLEIRNAPHGSTVPPPDAQQIPRDPNNGATQFDVFGVPVKFIAPVAASYSGSFIYHTYAGQPGRGQDAVGAAGSAGEP
ncbi:hypothetical protein [Acetobacter sp.]|uniref:hypothetical protein n=1 Tax=Acetobacter sp. TaxID=440 RepID=UPI0039ED599C